MLHLFRRKNKEELRRDKKVKKYLKQFDIAFSKVESENNAIEEQDSDYESGMDSSRAGSRADKAEKIDFPMSPLQHLRKMKMSLQESSKKNSTIIKKPLVSAHTSDLEVESHV